MNSPTSAGPALWRWAIEDEPPREGTADELIRQLASGQLPPYALVWREGWGEWLPAMQVEALASAFPEASRLGTRSARPSSIPGVPPVPVSDYPRLRHLAKAAPFGWPDGFGEQEEEVITAEVPAAALIEAARVMTQPSPPRDLGLLEAVRASRIPEATPVSSRLRDDRTPPSGPALPLAAEFGLQSLLEQEPPRRSGSLWLRANGSWIALAAIALGLGLTFAVRHFWLSEARPRAEPALSTSQRALEGPEPRVAPAAITLPPAEPAPAPGCSLLHPPASIDDWAAADVRPLVASLSDEAAVVAYAQSHTTATGGVLDVETLKLTRRYWKQDERQIYSVTPLVAGSKTSYHTERMGDSVAFGRALDTLPPLRLGMTEDGLVLGRFEQRLARLWELPFGSKLSVPEVVAHPLGFTLATRAGRGSGTLRLGLLGSTGQALSALAELGPEGWDLGRPALASGPEQTLLAVARRAGAAGPDALLLARSRNGELPVELTPFEVPDGGGAELLAPLVAALPDGSFALSWSQGAGSLRVVRLQRLSPELAPQGPALDLTSPDPALGGAMAAALHWAGDRLLAFYFLRRDAGHSLWVGSLSCG